MLCLPLLPQWVLPLIAHILNSTIGNSVTSSTSSSSPLTSVQWFNSTPVTILCKVRHQSPKFAALKEIKLGFNQITEIPSTAFDSNSSVTANYYIELDHNRISQISFSAFNFPLVISNIKLNLSKNNITKIETGAFIFPNAKFFLPSEAEFIKINLQSNSISAMPFNFFNCPSAKYISLDFHNNKITSIPSGLFNCPYSLHVSLDFHNNLINSISSGTFYFPNATDFEILLNDNRITTINERAFDRITPCNKDSN